MGQVEQGLSEGSAGTNLGVLEEDHLEGLAEVP